MIYLKGSSGERYRFYSFKDLSNLKKAGGVYLLTKKNKNESKACYEVIYVGETPDMSSLSVEYLSELVPNAVEANCYCIRLEEDDESRSRTYNDLKESYTVDCV